MAVADHQTAGRGRLGRTWSAPAGSSLLASVLLRPHGLEPDRRHLVTAALALSAACACAEVAGLTPDLKWPNDLVVSDRKLAGVLAEVEGDAVVVGIGVNVTDDGLPPGATALELESGRAVDRDLLLERLLADLGGRYGDWDEVAISYRRSCSTVGRLVRVELSDETLTGRAVDVSPEGHLVVDVGVCLRTVAAGDVVHLRPVS